MFSANSPGVSHGVVCSPHDGAGGGAHGRRLTFTENLAPPSVCPRGLQSGPSSRRRPGLESCRPLGLAQDNLGLGDASMVITELHGQAGFLEVVALGWGKERMG